VKVDLSDMILEHLVDELASFLNMKSQSDEDGSVRPSNVEIYELMEDEPEFAKTYDRVVIPGQSTFSPERIDLQVQDDDSIGSFKKLDNARRTEA
jgi:hypothetical protein